MSDLQTKIYNDYQKYFDEPIYVKPKAEFSSELANCISAAFNIDQLQPLVVGHTRCHLKWMKPRNDGKLIITRLTSG